MYSDQRSAGPGISGLPHLMQIVHRHNFTATAGLRIFPRTLFYTDDTDILVVTTHRYVLLLIISMMPAFALSSAARETPTGRYRIERRRT
jgi:hypothetical protein